MQVDTFVVTIYFNARNEADASLLCSVGSLLDTFYGVMVGQ